MFISSWLPNRKTTAGARPPAHVRKPARIRPGLELLEDRSVPAILSVTTALDVVDPGDGLLSLREAVQQANPATPGGDTVIFDSTLNGQIIVLNGSSLTINKNLNIQGPGADLLSISGNHMSPVFSVFSVGVANLSDLTIRDGKALSHPGGGIFNNGGVVTIRDCVFSGNSGDAGAIYNTWLGKVTVSGSVFSNNSSTIGGGAIRNNSGTVTVSDSIFRDNWTSLASGGAIYNAPNCRFTLTDCSLTGNTAWGGSGGAIYHVGTLLTVSGCFISGNSCIDTGSGKPCSGGGIYSHGQASLLDSTITGNSADHDGGGIVNHSKLTVSGCTVSGNQARGVASGTTVTGGSGGGIFNKSVATITSTTISNNSALVSGGGVYSANLTITTSSLTVTGCTISGNSADIGGGVYNTGASKAILTIKDSTITGNAATSKGGGVYNNGAASIQNTTLSTNSAALQGGGIFNDSSGVLTLYSSASVTGNLAPSGADLLNLGRITKKKG